MIMVERLKSWESPRRKGRNNKGKGGSARARQLKKRARRLRQKLQQNQIIETNKEPKVKEGEDNSPSLFLRKSVQVEDTNFTK